jgi:hypothetical protein
VYDLVTQRVRVSRDVVFDEQSQWKWGEDVEGGCEVNDTFTIEDSVTRDDTIADDTRMEVREQ